jgi:hypothetical protein
VTPSGILFVLWSATLTVMVSVVGDVLGAFNNTFSRWERSRNAHLEMSLGFVLVDMCICSMKTGVTRSENPHQDSLDSTRIWFWGFMSKCEATERLLLCTVLAMMV